MTSLFHSPARLRARPDPYTEHVSSTTISGPSSHNESLYLSPILVADATPEELSCYTSLASHGALPVQTYTGLPGFSLPSRREQGACDTLIEPVFGQIEAQRNPQRKATNYTSDQLSRSDYSTSRWPEGRLTTELGNGTKDIRDNGLKNEGSRLSLDPCESVASVPSKRSNEGSRIVGASFPFTPSLFKSRDYSSLSEAIAHIPYATVTSPTPSLSIFGSPTSHKASLQPTSVKESGAFPSSSRTAIHSSSNDLDTVFSSHDSSILNALSIPSFDQLSLESPSKPILNPNKRPRRVDLLSVQRSQSHRITQTSPFLPYGGLLSGEQNAMDTVLDPDIDTSNEISRIDVDNLLNRVPLDGPSVDATEISPKKDIFETNKNILAQLNSPAVFVYCTQSSNTGCDVWPDLRDLSKAPLMYAPVQQNPKLSDPTAGLEPDGTPKPSGFTDLPANSENQLSTFNTSDAVKESFDTYVCPVKNGKGWPLGKIPAEIFGQITRYLCRDDIKAMRLVSKEFEHLSSDPLFRTVVVPFNTEIYGMLSRKQKWKGKGKGKAKFGRDSIGGPFFWKNAKAEDIYTGHGLEVFKGFGPHILKYGMAFEIDEARLAQPPVKNLFASVTSFWGEYEWPHPQYTRFDAMDNLEIAAEENSLMKMAFSYLGRTRELALSLDSGLGWLKGPDMSIRSRIMSRPPPVFGSSMPSQERYMDSQEGLWTHIQSCYEQCSNANLKRALLAKYDPSEPLTNWDVYQLLPSSQPHWKFLDGSVTKDIPTIGKQKPPKNTLAKIKSKLSLANENFVAVAPAVEQADNNNTTLYENFDTTQIDGEQFGQSDLGKGPEYTHTLSQGILFTTTREDNEFFESIVPAFAPNSLNTAQMEWLMETEWAQCAFLSSYMLAVMDNPYTFTNVHTLNLARISSRYLAYLARHDFWNSLPQLTSVIIKVIPEWRVVVRDRAGFLSAPRTTPSSALTHISKLLNNIIAPRKNIKHLAIGWESGGEHAEGCHARNRNILPAPVLPKSWLNSNFMDKSLLAKEMSVFQHVEHLTLINCWIPPDALRILIRQHRKSQLRKLTLDSVSLTVPLQPLPPQLGQGQGLGGPFLAFNPAVNQPGINPIAGPINPPQGANMMLGQAGNGLHPHLAAFLAQQPQPAFAGWVGPVPVIPPPNPPTWEGPHRLGSWPYVIDIISPGNNLADFGSQHSNASGEPHRSKLSVLEFKSCGYARIGCEHLDQSAIQPSRATPLDPWFEKRYSALAKYMMISGDPLLGEIVQYIPPHEEEALRHVWGLRMGWRNMKKAEEAEFDGRLPGGTGRFSGQILKLIHTEQDT